MLRQYYFASVPSLNIGCLDIGHREQRIGLCCNSGLVDTNEIRYCLTFCACPMVILHVLRFWFCYLGESDLHVGSCIDRDYPLSPLSKD